MIHKTIFTTQLSHLANLAKWLNVRIRTRCLWVRVPLQSLKTSDFAAASSKEFLDIQATIGTCFFLTGEKVTNFTLLTDFKIKQQLYNH